MVLNATFNTISVISRRSILLVEKTGGPGEKPPTCRKLTDKLYHIILYTSSWSRFELTISAVIGTDRIGSCNPTAPLLIYMRVAANKESTEPTEEFLVIKLKSSIRKF
jgi:hypothetical protein